VLLPGTWTPATPAEGREGDGGVPQFPLATMLVIKVSPPEVILDSDTGSARSRQKSIYELDGISTNVPGPLANILRAARADEKAPGETARRGIRINTRGIAPEAGGER
jgi:hypothetical protein